MKGKRILVFLVLLFTARETAFGAWFDHNYLIAHALGEAEGKIETNSKEAFLSSWGNGFRVMEADFCYTSDGVLVVRHDFTADGSYYRLEQAPQAPLVMDSTEYINSKIIYEQTPMKAADLLDLMAQYPDVYIITDTKEEDKATVQRQFADLKASAEAMGNSQVLQRMIPQIYNKEMLGWIQEIYPFQEWIYTSYLEAKPNYEEIGKFCKDNGIGAVALEKEKLTKSIVSQFHDKGIRVYAHTVNRYEQFRGLLDLGVNGIYTDRIKPYELSWVGRTDQRQKTEKAVTVAGKSKTMPHIQIFGAEYVPLRQLGDVGIGFSAVFDKAQNKLFLTGGEIFHTLGNELLLEESNKMIMEKGTFAIFYNETATDIPPILIDGEVYVPVDKMLPFLVEQ